MCTKSVSGSASSGAHAHSNEFIVNYFRGTVLPVGNQHMHENAFQLGGRTCWSNRMLIHGKTFHCVVLRCLENICRRPALPKAVAHVHENALLQNRISERTVLPATLFSEASKCGTLRFASPAAISSIGGFGPVTD